MNETITAIARAMVVAKALSATGGCDGGAGPRQGVLGRRRQSGRQGGCGGGFSGDPASGTPLPDPASESTLPDPASDSSRLANTAETSRSESGSGSEGGGGGDAGGGCGGKIGVVTATVRFAAFRPRSAASVLAMLLVVRLFESV